MRTPHVRTVRANGSGRAKLEASEAADGDRVANGLGHALHQLRNGQLVVLHENLVDQADIAVEFFDLTDQGTFDDLFRLTGQLGILPVESLFRFQNFAGNLSLV